MVSWLRCGALWGKVRFVFQTRSALRGKVTLGFQYSLSARDLLERCGRCKNTFWRRGTKVFRFLLGTCSWAVKSRPSHCFCTLRRYAFPLTEINQVHVALRCSNNYKVACSTGEKPREYIKVITCITGINTIPWNWTSTMLVSP